MTMRQNSFFIPQLDVIYITLGSVNRVDSEKNSS